MSKRTFAIGDIHGDPRHLAMLLSRFPPLREDDTLVFLGDYIDRGPDSAEVVEYVRALSVQCKAKVVALRGNHEDAWLRVIDQGWPEFIMPPGNGCLACYRSYTGGPPPGEDDIPSREEIVAMFKGEFFPPDVVEWMRSLPFWYEDEHAIYVHAGLPNKPSSGPSGTAAETSAFQHPSEVEDKLKLLWLRDKDFFENYRGKKVVFGHTSTELLPPELSTFTPEDPTDLWAGVDVIGIDTKCGKGGFLTAIEFPLLKVYESR